MKKRPWSDEERARLKKFYNEIPMDELSALFPNRTIKAIQNQVHYLRKRGWTFKRSNE